MALGDPYVSLAEIKAYLKLDDQPSVELDSLLTDAINSASREIERHCNRQFNKVTVATPRVFRPVGKYLAKPDDFHTTTGFVLEVDTGDNGNFDTLVSASGYELRPYNGVVDGQPGWPYWTVQLVDGSWFPCRNRRKASVRVTAQWGWAEVPSPVKQACFILAAENFAMKGAPLGVAGFGEFGVVRVRNNKVVEDKLSRFVRDKILVG